MSHPLAPWRVVRGFLVVLAWLLLALVAALKGILDSK